MLLVLSSGHRDYLAESGANALAPYALQFAYEVSR